MTTIAYKDGIIAYDSRMVCNGLIVDDLYEKEFFKDNIYIFYCGDVGDIEEFNEAVFSNANPSRELDCEALVVYSGKLYAVDIFETRLRKAPLRLSCHTAIGSGSKLALAFMDTGMTAEEAVIATCKRDTQTGGVVRTHVINM